MFTTSESKTSKWDKVGDIYLNTMGSIVFFGFFVTALLSWIAPEPVARFVAALYLFGTPSVMGLVGTVGITCHYVSEAETWYAKVAIGLVAVAAGIAFTLFVIWRDLLSPEWFQWAIDIWTGFGLGG